MMHTECIYTILLVTRPCCIPWTSFASALHEPHPTLRSTSTDPHVTQGPCCGCRHHYTYTYRSQCDCCACYRSKYVIITATDPTVIAATDPSATTAGHATTATAPVTIIVGTTADVADGISSQIMCLNAGGLKAKFFSNANAT